jgi:hypothetical protein
VRGPSGGLFAVLGNLAIIIHDVGVSHSGKAFAPVDARDTSWRGLPLWGPAFSANTPEMKRQPNDQAKQDNR